MNNKVSQIQALGKSIKDKAINVTSDVLSAPQRAYYGAKSALANMQRDRIVGMRNFKNRKTDTNKYKSNSYWAKNTN